MSKAPPYTSNEILSIHANVCVSYLVPSCQISLIQNFNKCRIAEFICVVAFSFNYRFHSTQTRMFHVTHQPEQNLIEKRIFKKNIKIDTWLHQLSTYSRFLHLQVLLKLLVQSKPSINLMKWCAVTNLRWCYKRGGASTSFIFSFCRIPEAFKRKKAQTIKVLIESNKRAWSF